MWVYVFAWSTEEEKPNEAHVADRTLQFVSGSFSNMTDNGERNGFFSLGGWVLPFPGLEQLLKSIFKFVGTWSEANVAESQAGHRLTDFAYGTLHCSRSDGLTAGGNTTIAISLGEDVDERDWVLDIFQKGVQVELFAIIDPYVPGVVRRIGTFSASEISAGFPDKQEVSAERIARREWHSFQDSFCG